MSQDYTVLLDLDGTLVDTAPDLMMAHNHVMSKFGYKSKTTEEIRNLVGKGAGVLIGRSIWGSAKKEFSKVTDKKIKDEMIKEFILFVNHFKKFLIFSFSYDHTNFFCGNIFYFKFYPLYNFIFPFI